MKRFLSGIQPSGLPHLGNWFGAMAMHLELAREGEAYWFIADLHALTTVKDAAKLREMTREVAVSYLAMGLDPERTCFWRQSDVPEVTEVAWLLGTVSGMGLLERGHSYKDKVAQGLTPSVGLFYYPVLMAADIICFDADEVPVGKDQIQHVEFAQDMAGAFDAVYGPTFKRPEWRLSKTPKVSGLDGQKMSKSYGNALWIFEEGKALTKGIGRLPTDSRAPSEPKDPDGMLIFEWLKLLISAEEYEALATRAREGGDKGPGYGELKKRIASAMDERFGAGREERKRLLAHPEHVEQVLLRGAEKARAAARSVRDRAYKACGLR